MSLKNENNKTLQTNKIYNFKKEREKNLMTLDLAMISRIRH